MSTIIEVADLAFGYTPGSTILEDVTFKVESGTFLAIAGPNGAGKSTLLNLLSGTLKPQCGTIHIDGKCIDSYNTKGLAEKIAVVRQEFVPVFDFSVVETVMMARTVSFGPGGFETKMDKETVSDALKATDTTQFAVRSLKTLSSGERQRVFIARALAQNAPILLLDEPTSFLDIGHQVAIYDLLKATQLGQGKTIVAVTHDLNLAAQYCDEALLLFGCSGAASRLDSDAGRPANRGYCVGKTADIFSIGRIEEVFGVRVFAGNIGRERFFIPLGKFAKDAGHPTNSNQGTKVRGS